MNAFRPNTRGTLAIAANATAQNVALPLGGGGLIQFVNTGPQPAFVELTSDANLVCAVPTAGAGGGFAVPANVPAMQLRIPIAATRMSLVSTGNATVYATRGDAN